MLGNMKVDRVGEAIMRSLNNNGSVPAAFQLPPMHESATGEVPCFVRASDNIADIQTGEIVIRQGETFRVEALLGTPLSRYLDTMYGMSWKLKFTMFTPDDYIDMTLSRN